MEFTISSIPREGVSTLLQDDISTELRKGIYKNITKSGLHRAAVKAPVLPCLNVIEWITWKVDHENRSILYFEDKSVASYKESILNQIYHFREACIKVTPEWLKQMNESVDFLTIMKGWWSE